MVNRHCSWRIIAVAHRLPETKSRPHVGTVLDQVRLGLSSLVHACAMVASSVGIIQFHYPIAVDNDPLLTPIRVLAVVNDTLLLEDGRRLLVDTYDRPLDEMIAATEYRIDIESDGTDAGLLIFGTRRGWICGTPWVGLIEIPLIADPVPINYRDTIASAKLISE